LSCITSNDRTKKITPAIIDFVTLLTEANVQLTVALYSSIMLIVNGVICQVYDYKIEIYLTV